MSITHSYVDFGAGDDTTGDGSVGTPWKTLQHAFDTLTRNTTDGNQVNLKAGTAHVNAAALDLTTFIAGGALAAVAPLIIRGYTSAANDGGIGEIDCGGATMWAATTYAYVILADLEMHTFGNNNGIVLDDYCTIYHCEVHKGTSSPFSRILVSLDLASIVTGCYIHDSGAGNNAHALRVNSSGFISGNYIELGADVGSGTTAIYATSYTMVTGNIICNTSTLTRGIYANDGYYTGNIVYNQAAATVNGITVFTGSGNACIFNNIVIGYSGVGGVGIATDNQRILGHNAFYNNTANYTASDQTFLDLTTNDVALAADPFTDAANGDFSLTAAAKTALAAKGFPISYLGAHANTVSNLNIGPIQLTAGSGSGGVYRPVARILGG